MHLQKDILLITCNMNICLEYKKVKRTGFIQLFLSGAILAAAVPVVNMVFRTEMYTSIHDTPVQILLGANWQLMAMFNVLVIVTGTCLLYHIEYDNNSIQNHFLSLKARFS